MSRVIAAFSQFFKGDGSPLANGYLRFLISQTTSTDKATYADVDQTIPNANPVQLDGEGRCPNVFGQGIYKVVLYDINPVTGLPGMMLQTFDPVVADYQSEGAGGNFAEWESGAIYQIGQIVIYNGLYYRSHIANNVGNQPDISADSWERIDFLRFWNLDVTYGLDDVVIYGSQLYFSLQAGNLNHIPSTSPAWWDPVGSGTVLLNWQESGTAFIPVSAGYDLGSAANFIGDFYQGDNSIHYFGTGQDASLYFDSNDFYITTVGDLIAGTLDASEIILTTQSFARWRIKSDGHLIPDANLDIGGAALPVGDVYQGSDQHLYIGDSQQIDLNYDGTDLYLNIGANAWALLAAGNIEPQTDATFYFGGASNRLRQIYVSDDPSVDDHVVIKSYLDSSLYTLKTNKNYFDNPNLEVWQRATSIPATTSIFFAADRVRNIALGSGSPTIAVSRQAIPYDYSLIPNRSLYYQRNVVVAGTPSADNSVFNDMAILNVEKLSGKQVTFSVYLRSDATRDVSVMLNQEFGSGGSATVQTFIDKITLTTDFVRYPFTFTVPSISGLTIGTISATRIRIYYSAGSDFDSITDTLGEQSGTFDIADIQLEDGPIATDFEQIDFNKNLLRCLPYCQKSFSYEIAPADNVAADPYPAPFVAPLAGSLQSPNFFQIPMAIIPQVILYSSTDGTPVNGQWAYYNGTAFISGTTTTARISKTGFYANLLSSGPSIGQAYIAVGFWLADTGY